MTNTMIEEEPATDTITIPKPVEPKVCEPEKLRSNPPPLEPHEIDEIHRLHDGLENTKKKALEDYVRIGALLEQQKAA